MTRSNEGGDSALFLGSTADVKGETPYGTYTKAVLRSYVHRWTTERAPRGMRVNRLSPGPTDTAMMTGAPEAMRTALIEGIPLARMGARR